MSAVAGAAAQSPVAPLLMVLHRPTCQRVMDGDLACPAALAQAGGCSLLAGLESAWQGFADDGDVAKRIGDKRLDLWPGHRLQRPPSGQLRWTCAWSLW